jgi:hypothetical protein
MTTPSALPTVLLGPPTFLPVASTSTAPPPLPTIRCSQCKTDKPHSHFPVRLINLQPYHVCKIHEWYWTKEKQAVHWVPDDASSVERICEGVRQLREGAEGATDKWLVKAGAEDRAALVGRIASAGKWKAKSK